MYRVRSVQSEFIVCLLLLFVSETVEMLLMAGTCITLDNFEQEIDFRSEKIFEPKLRCRSSQNLSRLTHTPCSGEVRSCIYYCAVCRFTRISCD